MSSATYRRADRSWRRSPRPSPKPKGIETHRLERRGNSFERDPGVPSRNLRTGDGAPTRGRLERIGSTGTGRDGDARCGTLPE